jgi:hypothetical protein
MITLPIPRAVPAAARPARGPLWTGEVAPCR